MPLVGCLLFEFWTLILRGFTCCSDIISAVVSFASIVLEGRVIVSTMSVRVIFHDEARPSEVHPPETSLVELLLEDICGHLCAALTRLPLATDKGFPIRAFKLSGRKDVVEGRKNV